MRSIFLGQLVVLRKKLIIFKMKYEEVKKIW